MEFAVTQFRNKYLAAPSFLRFFVRFLLHRLSRIVPEVEPRADAVIKSVLDRDDQWPAVVFEKRERGPEAREGEDEGCREIERQDAIDEVARAQAAEDVDELFERERPEDLVFDLDELGYLELHTLASS